MQDNPIQSKRKRRRKRYNYLCKLKKAKTLQVTVYSFNRQTKTYLVTGENQHVVMAILSDKLDCDCGNSFAPCSHVMAVQLFTGELKDEPAKSDPIPIGKKRSMGSRKYLHRRR